MAAPPPAAMIFARQYALFYDGVGRQLKAGLPASRALANVLAGPLPDPLRAVVADVQRRVDAGEGVADGLGRHPAVIPRHEARFLQAAEAAGKLPEACAQLADAHRKRHERTVKFAAKLVYPLMILLAAFWIAPVKRAFDGDPLGWLATAGPPTLLALAVLAGGVWIGHAPAAGPYRKRLYEAASGVPKLSGALRQLAIARIGQLMALCFQAGLPADQVLRLVGESTPDRRLAKACLAASAATAKGQDVAGAMDAQKGAFPPMMVTVVRTGEEAGSLDEALGKAAEFWAEDADRAVGMLVAIASGAIMGLTFMYVGWLIVDQWLGIIRGLDRPPE